MGPRRRQYLGFAISFYGRVHTHSRTDRPSPPHARAVPRRFRSRPRCPEKTVVCALYVIGVFHGKKPPSARGRGKGKREKDRNDVWKGSKTCTRVHIRRKPDTVYTMFLFPLPIYLDPIQTNYFVLTPLRPVVPVHTRVDDIKPHYNRCAPFHGEYRRRFRETADGRFSGRVVSTVESADQWRRSESGPTQPHSPRELI